MAFIPQENILRAVKTVWDNDAALVASVPGGLWSGAAVPEAQAGSTYAVVKVTEQPPFWTSGTAYWQNFTLEFRVWSQSGATAGGAVRSNILAAFSQATKGNLSITGASKVIHLLPDAGGLEPDSRRRQARDVLIASVRYSLAVQGAV